MFVNIMGWWLICAYNNNNKKKQLIYFRLAPGVEWLLLDKYPTV